MLVELQTEFSDGKRDKARIVRLKILPGNENVEKCQRKTDMGFKVLPSLMRHVLEVADVSQHGKNCFNDHADIPLTSLTEAEIVRMPVLLSKVNVRKDHHVMPEFVDKLLKSRAIINIGCLALPVNNATKMIQHKTEFAAHNPALIREPFLPDLVG